MSKDIIRQMSNLAKQNRIQHFLFMVTSLLGLTNPFILGQSGAVLPSELRGCSWRSRRTDSPRDCTCERERKQQNERVAHPQFRHTRGTSWHGPHFPHWNGNTASVLLCAWCLSSMNLLKARHANAAQEISRANRRHDSPTFSNLRKLGDMASFFFSFNLVWFLWLVEPATEKQKTSPDIGFRFSAQFHRQIWFDNMERNVWNSAGVCALDAADALGY